MHAHVYLHTKDKGLCNYNRLEQKSNVNFTLEKFRVMYVVLRKGKHVNDLV